MQRIVEWLAEEFKSKNGVDLFEYKQAIQRLTEAAAKAKNELATSPESSIRFALLFRFN